MDKIKSAKNNDNKKLKLRVIGISFVTMVNSYVLVLRFPYFDSYSMKYLFFSGFFKSFSISDFQFFFSFCFHFGGQDD